MKLLAIDPGNIESAYVVIDGNYRPLEFGKEHNSEILEIIDTWRGDVDYMAIEMIASYGMGVGASVFDTCVWIGRFTERAGRKVEYIYRGDVKMNLCHTKKAKDGNIIRALADRFAYGQPNYGKGTKHNKGCFYGFAADIWQAYAVAVTYLDTREEKKA
jgi:hypothetical protein